MRTSQGHNNGSAILVGLASMAVILSLISIVFLVKINQSVGQSNALIQTNKKNWSASKMREYANRLKADGLTEQARLAYEDYLQHSGSDIHTRANIYYSIGEMLFQSKRYEDALSYFYKAETAYPEFELKSEIGTYIVSCLENMGKDLDAQYQLESRSALGGEEIQATYSGDIVARIGKRDIRMGEINAALEKLPPWIADEYKQDESRKLEFVQNYVSSELLYEKGRKLGLHKSTEMRQQMADIQKGLVTQKLLLQEITDKVNLDPEDIRNYYEAHKDNYKTLATDEDPERQKTFEEAATQVQYEYRKEKEARLSEELLARLLQSKDVHIYTSKFKPANPKELPGDKEANESDENNIDEPSNMEDVN